MQQRNKHHRTSQYKLSHDGFHSHLTAGCITQISHQAQNACTHKQCTLCFVAIHVHVHVHVHAYGTVFVVNRIEGVSVAAQVLQCVTQCQTRHRVAQIVTL